MSIEQRLKRLEWQYRIWMSLASCLVVVLLLGASRTSPPALVQAQKFELVDACGNVRAELMMEDGLPSLVFTSLTHAKCTSIGLYRDPAIGEGGRVFLGNADTDCSIGLQTGMNSAQLWLNGGQNRYINLLARSHSDQKPIIWMTDEYGLRARLSTKPERGQLQLFNTKEVPTFSAP